MYQQFNEQFAAATRQFADTAAQVNRLALENAQAVFGLQLAAIETQAQAAFGFASDAANARDVDGLKDLMPKAVQVARENLERSVTVGQEVLGRNVKTNERIAEIARSQFEATARDTQSNVEQAARSVTEKAQSFAANTGAKRTDAGNGAQAKNASQAK